MLDKLIRKVKVLTGKLGRAGKLSEKKLSRLESNLGYRFKNRKLLETALSHLSYTNDNGLKDTESNERLEFLGDSVVDMLVSEFLYRRFPGAMEGELTRRKSALVSRTTLAEVGKRLKLEDYIFVSGENLPVLDRGKNTIVSNCVEAVVGAVFIEGGLEAASQVVRKVILDNGRADYSIDHLQEAKNRLLHLSQITYGCQPVYKITETSGPEHAKRFHCVVSLKGEIMGRGEGMNKKESEKMAAANALSTCNFDEMREFN